MTSEVSISGVQYFAPEEGWRRGWSIKTANASPRLACVITIVLCMFRITGITSITTMFSIVTMITITNLGRMHLIN